MYNNSISIGIVEDEIEVLKYLTRAFEEADIERGQPKFQVFAASRVIESKSWITDDRIDIWIVDLNLPDQSGTQTDWTIGRNLIREIHQECTGGIIVYTSESLGDRANELLAIGADDFVQKAEVANEFSLNIELMQQYLRAKVLSVWKRARYSRPQHQTLALHSKRRFKVGNWIYTVASRVLTSDEETGKLTSNEHAVLRHLCVSDTHSINKAEYLAFVTGQRSEQEDVRLKNLVYRLRKKLGDSVLLLESSEGYQLHSIVELPQN